MPRADAPSGVQVSYRPQYRRCGKAGCSRCVADGPGHGPYWYAFWWEGGRARSRYLGKQAPTPVTPGSGAAHLVERPASEALRVRTLGGFMVWRGETAIGPHQLAGRRATALFKCLLGTPGHRLSREQAAELLWPEADPAAGAANLRTTIHLLRQVLDGPDGAAGYLRTDGQTLVLAPAGDAVPVVDWLDAAAFARAAEAALAGQNSAACRAALALYAGDYLPDDSYEAWAAPLRESLRRQHRRLYLHLAGLCATHGDPEGAEACLRRVLADEPGHEGAAATLMGLLAAAGRRHEALHVYQALTTALEEDLDVAPGAEIVALRARILAQEAALAATAVPPAQPLPTRLTNLPAALTSFVGRVWEVTAVAEALAAARLVTLTGPGGCGKTRLALEAAGRVAAAYPDGVWLVELAALAGTAFGDAPLVAGAVAAALGLPEQAERPVLDLLRDFLRPRRLLLVLDNCEHLIVPCAALAHALLQSCPRLCVLATSRERLEVGGERTFLVPSLAVPDPDDLPALERLAACESVQLFLQRAQARRPNLTLTPQNAPVVAAICARLDGLPLAIELAAARASSLPIEAIASRLDDRFRLLTGGPRTALPRQQTLRGTLEWSYELLEAPERALLGRLAVFVGGCTPEAAEAVCADDPALPAGGVAADEVLDLLSGLVRRSLVILEDRGGEGRFRLLETVRQYGWERLEATGELAILRDRHLRWCLTLGERAAPHLRGAEQLTWLDRLECEHQNLRAALRWSLEEGRSVATGVALAGAIWPLWALRGYLQEGQRWLEAALAAADFAPNPVRARVLLGAQSLALSRGDFARVEALGMEGAALARQAGDRAALARFLINRAWARTDVGQARALGEEGLAAAREAGARDAVAAALQQLGNLHIGACDLARTQAYLDGCADLYHGLGDRVGLADALMDLGQVAFRRGRYAQADALFEECLAHLRALGHPLGIAVALNHRGYAVYYLGDSARAVAVLDESVGLCRRLGNQEHLAMSLGERAWVAWHEGDGALATRLLAEALAIAREREDALNMVALLSKLGQVVHGRCNLTRAEAIQLRALLLMQEVHVTLGVAECLERLACTLAAQGHWRGAARIFGASSAHRESAGTPVASPERAALDSAIAATRAGLGVEVCAAAWAAGRAMTLEQAVSEALARSLPVQTVRKPGRSDPWEFLDEILEVQR